MRIRIRWQDGELEAVLNDTANARDLFTALPVRSRAHTWGDEVYFEVPVTALLEDDARQVVPPGTVCFWVEGNSVAIPFGPTPISQGDECRLVTRVNILGRVEGDPTILKGVGEGDSIDLEACQGEET